MTMGMTYSSCSETLVSLPILGRLPQFFQKPWRWSSFPSRCSHPDLLDLYPYILMTSAPTHCSPFVSCYCSFIEVLPDHSICPYLASQLSLSHLLGHFHSSSCTPIGMIKASSRSVTSLTCMNSCLMTIHCHQTCYQWFMTINAHPPIYPSIHPSFIHPSLLKSICFAMYHKSLVLGDKLNYLFSLSLNCYFAIY